MAEPLTPEQAAAARPSRSAWISASAGSGKTRVLTARVARCLLNGIRPDRILCLTYTRAAAGEMKTRLFDTLGNWATCSDEALGEALAGLLEPDESSEFGADRLADARRLFAQSLEFPGGLRIQTIHSFGLSLLRRFPREAGLSPGIAMLDEAQTEAMREDAFRETLRQARTDDGALGDAYRTLVAGGRSTLLDTLRQSVVEVRHRTTFRRFVRQYGPDDQAAAIRRFLGDEDRAAEAEAKKAYAEIRARAASLHRLVLAVEDVGGVNESKRLRYVYAALDDLGSGDEIRAARNLSKFFLKGGQPLKRPYVKDVYEALARNGAARELLGMPEILMKIERARRVEAVASASIAAARIATEYLERYEAAKRRESGLDYEDVIERVSALLTRSDAREWIRYRLDGGIDHILVDEAQDTSPAQWEALKRLSEEFFDDGEPRAKGRTGVLARRKGSKRRTEGFLAGGESPAEDRTVFAVGDEKQSIFSFQGAAPEEFAASRNWFDARLSERGGTLFAGSLQKSFRSSPAVLEFVDEVFREVSGFDPDDDGDPGWLGRRPADEFMQELMGYDKPPEHRSFHAGKPGRVEVWDLFDAFAPDLEPNDAGAKPVPEKVVARKVAERIASWIEGGVALPRSGRPIEPGDVMVIVQRRGAFSEELVRRLRLDGIPVAGADRIALADHIAVQDLLALIAFALLPDDDFTLAVLLRSPFCDVPEDDLFALAWNRGTSSLLSRLEEAAEQGDGTLRDAFAFLSDMRSAAGFHGPYEFLERALVRHDGRRRLLARLGTDAIEPIDALLAEAIAFQNLQRGSLEEFLWRMRASRTTAKTDASSGPSAVRILTVHGAKGLEAPVVIVPDSNRVPNFAAREQFLAGADGEGCPIPLFVRRSGDDTPETGALREGRKTDELSEYRRLLYVALTRAEEWLVVCGSRWRRKSKIGANPNCWHFLAEDAAEKLGRRIEDDEEAGIGTPWPGYLFERHVEKTVDPRAAPEEARSETPPDLPDWATSPAPAEAEPGGWTAASGIAKGSVERLPADDAAESRNRDRRMALQRGTLSHLLLERLANIPAGPERDDLARSLAERFGDALPEADRETLLRQALQIVDDPELRPLFHGEGLAEAWVALGSADGEGGLWGRIDRLALEEGRALILDYKGDPNPPDTPETTNPAYLAQLGAYRQAVSEIYPDRDVSTAILWSSAEPARLMRIPDAQVDAAFAEATERRKAS